MAIMEDDILKDKKWMSTDEAITLIAQNCWDNMTTDMQDTIEKTAVENGYDNGFLLCRELVAEQKDDHGTFDDWLSHLRGSLN